MIFRVSVIRSHPDFPAPVLLAPKLCSHATRCSERVSGNTGDAAVHLPCTRPTKAYTVVAAGVVYLPLRPVGRARVVKFVADDHGSPPIDDRRFGAVIGGLRIGACLGAR